MQRIRTGFIGRTACRLDPPADQPVESVPLHRDGLPDQKQDRRAPRRGRVGAHRGQASSTSAAARGSDAIEMVQRGAARVIGVDDRQKVLDEATDKARRAGVADRCFFTRQLRHQADTVVSIDGFEHYGDPAACLRLMPACCAKRPTLRGLRAHVVSSAGRPQPFAAFPWAHLLLMEKALLEWRTSPCSGSRTPTAVSTR